MLGVMAAGLGMMFLGVAGMPVGAVGVVRCLLVIAGLMVLGGLAVMLRRMLVMFGRLVMMVLGACVVSHISLPVQSKTQQNLRKSPDSMLTTARQVC
jgi:hypothetical protein